MTSECPNFIVEEDCCVSADVDTSNIRSAYIDNIESIVTNKFHASGQLSVSNSLYINEGHILTKQTVAPTLTNNATGITGATLVANSTDIAGTITVLGAPTAGAEVYIHFNTPFPTATIPSVSLTAADDAGAAAFVSGVYAGGDTFYDNNSFYF